MANKPTLHGYFGGKSKIGNWIQEFVPKNIKTYLEPFSGSFAVYFLIDTPNNSKIIYNDLNKDQTNLVACSKDYEKFYDYLKTELENTESVLHCKETDEALIKLHYKELYYSLKKSEFRNETFNIPDMKRASLYAFLLTSAFSSCSYTAAGFSGFKLKTFIKKLQNVELQKKLSNIDIFETLNFDEIIKKYDSPDTFIYLDPPYYEESDKRSGWYGTKDEFGQKEHLQLLELLKTTKSRWALSYYDFPALSEHLPKDKYTWLNKDFFRSSASFSENKSTKGTELLILNYDPNHITSDTPTSEKLINEIEEANGGAFIAPQMENEIIKNFVSEIVYSQKDIDPEIQKIVNEKFMDLIEPVVPKKDVEDDDFWNS